MQTVKFTSHRAREKAFGIVTFENSDYQPGTVYGVYRMSDDDYLRIKGIKGVTRVASQSDKLPTRFLRKTDDGMDFIEEVTDAEPCKL